MAYAALPEPITYQIAVLKACEHGDALVGWRVEPSRQSFDASMRPKRKLYTEGNMHDFADATHALRASHGQAPAQAAPAAVAWPVAVLKFERGTPGRENEMPRVVSCNWMPDGEYEVYLAAAPTTQPAPVAVPTKKTPFPPRGCTLP